MRAMLTFIRATVTRRRLSTFIIAAVAFLSTTTGVLALGLLVASDAPFDAAFAQAHGAEVTATFAPGTGSAALAATTSAAGVTATAGPFDQVTAALSAATGIVLPRGTIVGRSTKDGDVDRLALDRGSWLTGPGQIVLARDYAGPLTDQVGTEVTVQVPGAPPLRLVGIADSVTGSASAWIWPGQADILRASDAVAAHQLLYRFADGSTTAALAAGFAAATAGLPAGAVIGTSNYLTVRADSDRNIAPFVPFVVAFAVLGLLLAVLITSNVVSGAVISGTRTIGVLKTLGFTPGQVLATYLGQVLLPALLGCALGAGAGVLLAAPVLADTDRAYDLPAGAGGVPPWVVVLMLLAVPAVVALAAAAPAIRAGRLAPNRAITLGRAPQAGRGYRLRRALAATPLPRPLAFGLALPSARPARSVGTVVAVMLGAVTLVFAVGLSLSLHRVQSGFLRVDSVPIVVGLPRAGEQVGKPGGPITPTGPAAPVDPAQVTATVAAFAGTAHAVGVSEVDVGLVGAANARVEAYQGDASWVGYPMISGRWYGQPDEVVASSYLLRQTGHHVGDRLTIVGDLGSRSLLVVGEYLDGNSGLNLIAASTSLTGVVEAPQPVEIEVGLNPGTDVGRYAQTLQDKFGLESGVFVDDRTQGNNRRTFVILDALIATLALLLGTVAALGVLNTVVLTTRERIHEIGVLKAIGMTPGQVRSMLLSSSALLGLIGVAVAVPAGVLLQHRIVPAMAAAAGTGLPPSMVDVYRLGPLLLLGLAGVGVAIVGTMLPAHWAARGRAATALRAE